MDETQQINHQLQKSCYMLVGKKRTKLTNFKLYINHYPIELKNSIKYLRIHLDRELSWKTHIDYLAKKLSKVCGMIYNYVTTFLYQLFE